MIFHCACAHDPSDHEDVRGTYEPPYVVMRVGRCTVVEVEQVEVTAFGDTSQRFITGESHPCPCLGGIRGELPPLPRPMVVSLSDLQTALRSLVRTLDDTVRLVTRGLSGA